MKGINCGMFWASRNLLNPPDYPLNLEREKLWRPMHLLAPVRVRGALLRIPAGTPYSVFQFGRRHPDAVGRGRAHAGSGKGGASMRGAYQKRYWPGPVSSAVSPDRSNCPSGALAANQRPSTEKVPLTWPAGNP